MLKGRFRTELIQRSPSLEERFLREILHLVAVALIPAQYGKHLGLITGNEQSKSLRLAATDAPQDGPVHILGRATHRAVRHLNHHRAHVVSFVRTVEKTCHARVKSVCGTGAGFVK